MFTNDHQMHAFSGIVVNPGLYLWGESALVRYQSRRKLCGGVMYVVTVQHRSVEYPAPKLLQLAERNRLLELDVNTGSGLRNLEKLCITVDSHQARCLTCVTTCENKLILGRRIV